MAETTRRRDAATATIGLSGVAGAGALRHRGLEAAYGGGKRPPLLQEAKFLRRGKVPGRRTYLAGAGLGLFAVPPAAVGTARLLGHKTTTSKRDDRHRTLLEEGITGVRQSLAERTNTVKDPAPAKLMAANYLGGAAIGSATGGLVHRGLGKTRFPGAGRSALAAAAGVAAGAATIPAQSKMIERASRGQYIATPTGVRRARKKAVRPSQVATVVEGRPGRTTMHPHAVREQMGPVSKALRVKVIGTDPPRKVPRGAAAFGAGFTPRRYGAYGTEIDEAYARAGFKTSAGKKRTLRESERRAAVESTRLPDQPGLRYLRRPARVQKMALVSKGPLNTAGAHVGAHWTVNGLRLADKIDVPNRKAIPKTKRGRLVHTGRTKAANAVRSASFDVGSLNDKDALARNTVHGLPLFEEERYIGRSFALRKRDGSYYGQDLSRRQKRARVMAAGAAPFVGDYAAAGTAASMAPPELRGKTAALQFAGSQAGQAAGMAAGAYGLVHAAKHPAVKAKVERANDAIDAGTNAVRTAAGRKPKTGPGLAIRVAEHPRTPPGLRGALRPLAKNPKVAAVGALAGGMVGTQAGGYLGYGHALNLERQRNARLRRANPAGRRGTIKKRAGQQLTQEDHRRQARKKKIAANVATFTGLTGTGALAALGGSKLASARGAHHVSRRLESFQTPLLTAGAGVGGLGSFNFAAIQRKEAKAEQAQVKKGLRPLLPPPRLRAPAMRRGYLRQVRRPSGVIASSTVRGGLA